MMAGIKTGDRRKPPCWVALPVLCAGATQVACAADPVGAKADGPATFIRAGGIQGTKAIDEDELTSGLDQHPPEGWLFPTYATYDPLQLTLDRQRIQSYYKDRGYFSARVVETQVTPHEDGVRVAFIVEEGPPFLLQALRFTRSATVGGDVATQVGLIVGERFVYSAFEAIKTRMTAALVRQGYAHATVRGEVVVIEPKQSVEVTIDVDPGPLVRFGDISIDPGPLPEASIRARLSFKTGDLYDPALIAQSEGRLYELGMVGVVSFYLPTEGRPEVMDVRVEIRPGSRNELRMGFGLARQAPNYQMRLRIGYLRREVFDPLVSLSSEVRPALIYRPGDRTLSVGVEWNARLSHEDLFVPRLTGAFEVQYNLRQYEAFSTLGPVFRLLFDRPFLSDRFRLSIAAAGALLGFPRIEDVIPTDSYPSIGLPACGAECIADGSSTGLSLLFLEPAVTYDGRDDPVLPSIGGYARLQLEIGRTLNAPGDTWLRATPDVRGYVPLGTRRVVLAGRVRLGAKLLAGPPIPITQRYFGGGSESQRGFTIRQLSPFFGTGDAAVPVGGEALFELSTEVRMQLVKFLGMWLGLVVFVDAADVGTDFGDLDFLKPHVATGSGLRLYTPIGPLRFDVGYRLNRVAAGIEPGGSDRLALHLSLGEAF